MAKFQLLAEPSSGPDLITPRAGLAFAKLRQAFIEALIFYYFDLECHICIEINISRYVISQVLSQLTLDNFG